MKPFFQLLSQIYQLASGLRNQLYDRHFLQQVRASKKVISIGNLTVGGTGKTPLTQLCLQTLQQMGVKPGLVVRSYRASLKHPEKVQADLPQAASRYGDEAVMLAGNIKDIPIYSGPNKKETTLKLIQNENVDAVLLDDGFQHRRLHRDLDILVIDSTEPFANYQLLPAGRAREPFHNLKRAHAIFLTKINLCEESHLKILKNRFLKTQKVFEFEYGIQRVLDLQNQEIDFNLLSRVLLISGIARPESFIGLMRKKYPHIFFSEMHFRDHHEYKEDDLKKISAFIRSEQVGIVVTTQKDIVKLKSLWSLSTPLAVAELELKMLNPVEELRELLRL